MAQESKETSHRRRAKRGVLWEVNNNAEEERTVTEITTEF